MSDQTVIRVGTFIVILLLMGGAETLWPRRMLGASKVQRWFSNISIAVISTLLVRLLFPLAPMPLALYFVDKGWGLLNMIHIPSWLGFIGSVLLLDMLIYWQHVLFHKYRFLWRVHRMHHAETDIDASTGIRFHPIEIALSMIIKLAAIALLGPPAAAVLVFEILLNGCALFNHANLSLPPGLDRYLRLLVVTPDMHRVHHSTDMREANMNYGFNFPWWDRLFGTYKAQPDLGHQGMVIGLNIFREPQFLRLMKMLTMPFL